MHKLQKIVAGFLSATMMLTLSACGDSDNQNGPETQIYTIQYTDNSGIHSFDVEYGKLYSISAIPEKNGYEFLGLYDAEIGGTQYVNSGGSSVSEYNDKKNMVLYPQFKAKEYTLVLDYQGAAVTGSRSFTVGYNSIINDLPMNLTMENKNFVGWYTQPDKQGIQVADQYGVIPSKNIVDESVFDLSDPKGYIYLYAGFKGKEFNVTFYATENGAPEEVKVEYGTPISQVQLETRVDGNAVIAWSKKKNDADKEEVFNGKVTSEMVLYAAELAPVIDFDSNGGSNINSIIARAGDAVKLPTPSRENYKFIGWQDGSGNAVNYSTMPENSVKLNAKWQAMIVFDTNGGTEVQSISEPQGTKITLPTTEKAGYMFVGWYDGSGAKYEKEAMPSNSVKLFAKYMEVKRRTVVLVDASKEYAINNRTMPSVDAGCFALDLSDLYNSGIRSVKLTVKYQAYIDSTSENQGMSYVAWYSTRTASNAYKVWEFSDEHKGNYYYSRARTTDLALNSSTFYICFWAKYAWSNRTTLYLKDFYIEVEYPDMSTLY